MLVSLLLKYWKPLALVFVSLLIVVCSYIKGYRDCNAAWTIRQEKELVQRYEEWVKERNKSEGIVRKIDDARKNSPSDSLDSCLLSNNPLKTKCVQ
jgi:hypothetical protein